MYARLEITYEDGTVQIFQTQKVRTEEELKDEVRFLTPEIKAWGEPKSAKVTIFK